jgi:hypothetical protein
MINKNSMEEAMVTGKPREVLFLIFVNVMSSELFENITNYGPRSYIQK